MEPILVSAVLSLSIGLAVGYAAHLLQTRRAERDRGIADATELWDRCSEVANARVKYILAYHRRSPNKAQLNDEHHDLKRRFRWADPEVALMGVPEYGRPLTTQRSRL